MKLRVVLTTALVVASALALTGPIAPTYAAAAVCQGQPATIEGSTGTITGTEGNDVIVSTGPDTDVRALGGNDLICVVGGSVETGPGDDSVVSTAPANVGTTAFLFGGNDSYVGGAGGDDVTADEVTSLHVTMGDGVGFMWLYPTSTPGTGTVEFGPGYAFLYAFGESEALVDIPRQTARIDGLLTLTVVGAQNVSATGNKVRLTGDEQKNQLYGYGCNIVIKGGDGRDRLARVGSDGDNDLPPCHHYRSVFKGQDGPDRLSGRNGDDILLGGRGRDVAEGSGGNDRCAAEIARHCER
jgi:Ca2+-binding RTX toxin-like protein